MYEVANIMYLLTSFPSIKVNVCALNECGNDVVVVLCQQKLKREQSILYIYTFLHLELGSMITRLSLETMNIVVIAD